MPHPVGAGHVAVHAVERCRLRRAQIGATILQLIPGERRTTAPALNGM